MKKKGQKKKISNKKLRKLSKVEFLLGLLIIITGGSIMIDLLGLSTKVKTGNSMINELLLFPLAMILLVTGIGVIAKSSKILESTK